MVSVSVIGFSPVKNAAMWLPVFCAQLERLEGVGEVVFTYGDSQDSTLALLKEYNKRSKKKIRVKREPPMGQILSSAQIGAIYSDFQQYEDIKNYDYVLMLDTDLMRMPQNLVARLKRPKKDIIAPYIWTLFHDSPTRMFYDSFVFRYKSYKFHPYRPPLNDGKPLQVDSVGTCFLVKTDVFLDVPYGDPYPHLKFCNDAREKGYEVWADPSTAVQHVDLNRFGMFHHQLEVAKAMQRGDPDPFRFLDQTPFITDSGRVVSTAEFNMEYAKAYTQGVVEE